MMLHSFQSDKIHPTQLTCAPGHIPASLVLPLIARIRFWLQSIILPLQSLQHLIQLRQFVPEEPSTFQRLHSMEFQVCGHLPWIILKLQPIPLRQRLDNAPLQLLCKFLLVHNKLQLLLPLVPIAQEHRFPYQHQVLKALQVRGRLR